MGGWVHRYIGGGLAERLGGWVTGYIGREVLSSENCLLVC